MTKDKLLARKADLEAQREQMLGNLNAISGALQILEGLLAECDAEEEPEKAEDAPA